MDIELCSVTVGWKRIRQFHFTNGPFWFVPPCVKHGEPVSKLVAKGTLKFGC
jgi:hypothetical protein